MQKIFGRIWAVLFLLFVGRLLCGTSEAQLGEERPIVVVIPSYNNMAWFESNLGSVLSQKYHNFRVVYIDDASPDGTGAAVDAYLKEWDTEGKVMLVRNESRRGALCNTYRGVWMCQPNEIVAILDGDDWFAHEHVLEKLNEVYSDPNVWTTYGQFRYYPCGSPGWARQLPAEVIQANAARYYDWVTTHLRTFYAGLFQKINMRDLFYDEYFFTTAGDLAYTWPIIEMAGRHSHFIPDVLYVYNVANQLNDHKVNADLQRYYTYIIRSRKPYVPVSSPY